MQYIHHLEIQSYLSSFGCTACNDCNFVLGSYIIIVIITINYDHCYTTHIYYTHTTLHYTPTTLHTSRHYTSHYTAHTTLHTLHYIHYTSHTHSTLHYTTLHYTTLHYTTHPPHYAHYIPVEVG